MKKKYIIIIVIVIAVVSASAWYWDQNRYSSDDCWYRSAPYDYCKSHNKPVRTWVLPPEK